MNPRCKWPFYSLPVGGEAIIPDKPSLHKRVLRYGARTGKVLMTRKRPDGRLVRRLA